MANSEDYFRTVVRLADTLETQGFEPVLVGGMALILMGSQRVTKDFDLLVTTQGPPADELVKTLYRDQLELVTKVSAQGEIVRTVDHSRVAAARLKTDKPPSCCFFNKKTKLRVDVLFDFPLPAHRLGQDATMVKVASGEIRVASPEHLLELKEIAWKDRRSASDAQDLEFLRRMVRG